ncbi:VanZ family protein [Lentibacillus cibarius]|uniref:VanZ family protein n=1 Tax=Lentibacillus cibarius TaxID=2583219 RepID=UPI00163D5DE3|nr:VanZ family protein [Lentibacillus cibarius]
MVVDYDLMFGLDKQVHFFSYTALSAFLGIMVMLLSDRESVKKRLSYLWMVLVTIGTAEEYRQYMVPGRSAEFLDAIANMLGISIGLAIPMLIAYRHHFLVKRLALYSIVFIPMLLGLLFLNERPFITMEEPIQAQLRKVVAFIGG